jgi:hypothetical protein
MAKPLDLGLLLETAERLIATARLRADEQAKEAPRDD